MLPKLVAILVHVCLFQNTIAQEVFFNKLSNVTLTLTSQQVTYDPSYFSIKYPNGDVPSDKGVCTDVIIRAYRLLNIDLQKKVHEDMVANFNLYPKNWGYLKLIKILTIEEFLIL